LFIDYVELNSLHIMNEFVKDVERRQPYPNLRYATGAVGNHQEHHLGGDKTSPIG